MDIFSFFKKFPQKQVLVKCTNCDFEYHLSPREVRILEKHNMHDPVCSVKEECDICHIGFMIPDNYTDKNGKTFVFEELKPKIKNLDPNSVMERIFSGHNVQKFGLFE